MVLLKMDLVQFLDHKKGVKEEGPFTFLLSAYVDLRTLSCQLRYFNSNLKDFFRKFALST